MTSFKLFLISRIRNLFGTAAKKYSVVSLPPPKRKKRYRAAFEFDKNTFNTQGLWFFSLLYPDSHAYTFLCKVNKGNGQQLNCINSLGELIDYSRVKAADYILG